MIIEYHGGEVVVWETLAWQRVTSFNGYLPGATYVSLFSTRNIDDHDPESHITSITIGAAFSSDTKFLLTARSDNTISVREAHTGKELTVLRGLSGLVCAAAFSPDGKSVVTVGADEKTRVWEVNTNQKTDIQ
jgi:WD40 repeat protein